MEGLKKDHRGLRRRPLYTPLVIVVGSLLGFVLIAAWLVTSWGSTTIVLVRHAERLPEASDPRLSELGQARAERLAGLLAQTGLSDVYVSEARRTQETAAPVAAATAATIRVIEAAEQKRLLRRLKWRHRGDVVLVVGHSNTIPAIADGLGAPIGVIDDADHAGLWIVSYSRLRGTRLLTLRY